MSRRFSSCQAAIVAGRAITSDARMVHDRACPGNTRLFMAQATVLGGRNVSRRFARGGATVMALGTTTRDSRMTERCAGPACRVVAAAAIRGSRYVSGWFAGR